MSDLNDLEGVFFLMKFANCDETFPSPSLRMGINGSSLPVLFTSKIRDRKEGIVIYSFYTWFSFLTWVWVNIFLEIVSSKTATTHIFQSGVRNWPASVSRRKIEVFNPQAWDSRLRCESCQVYDGRKPSDNDESSSESVVEGPQSSDSAGKRKASAKKRCRKKPRSRSSAAKMLEFLKTYSEKREKAEEEKLRILKEMNDQKTTFLPLLSIYGKK